uniref:Uncharacterized protein n=1 Tax=Pristionchus pacificus TaxID=54126 RepID=A0A2A6D270_PRIPA|eukprot:PDM84373.1 hypothetical protein PRIPAC_33396 [Pristionchus pacificus]
MELFPVDTSEVDVKFINQGLDFFRICFNFSPVLISSSISTSLANFTSKNDQGVLGQLDCQVVRQTYSYAADKLVFIWEGRPSTITVVCRG